MLGTETSVLSHPRRVAGLADSDSDSVPGEVDDHGTAGLARRPSPKRSPPRRARRRDPAEHYAHCIDGQANAANRRINDALGTQDSQLDPGDEGDGEDEQAS